MKIQLIHLPRVKITMLFLIIAYLLCQNPVHAEKGVGDYKHVIEEITLIEAIHRISEQYQVLFNYDRTIVSNIKVRYESQKFTSVDAAIASVLKETNLKYQIFSQRYVVIYKNDQEGIESLKEMIQHFQTIVDDREDVVFERELLKPTPRLMRTLPYDIIAARTITFSIEGLVTDQDGEPLIGVNIQVKGTNHGTATDFDGHFILDNVDANAILVISYIGYQTQEVAISGRSNLTITLLSDSQLLDEVVVVGYGTQRKETLTGAVSSVQGDEISRSGSNNISHTIAGKVSGISMVPTNGEPGSNPQIYIRGVGTTGSSSPLIVIDGIIRNNMNDISPSSIESVSVLKDAAAVAAYGLGGANGVILITTKSGVMNKRPEINFNINQGYQNPTWLPRPLNVIDYMTLQNEAVFNVSGDGAPKPYSSEYIESYLENNHKNPDLYPNAKTTELLNKAIPVGEYSINFTGGSSNMAFHTGGAFYNEKGLFEGYDFKRYNFNINLKANIAETTILDINSIYSNSNKSELSPYYSSLNLLRWIYFHKPNIPLYYTNGKWGDSNNTSIIGGINSGSYHRSNNASLLNTISIEQEIPFVEGLKVKGVFSFDILNNYTKGLSNPAYYWSQDTSTEPYTYIQRVSNMEQTTPAYRALGESYAKNQIFTYQGLVTYSKILNNHSLDLLGVIELREGSNSIFNASMNNLPLNIDEFSMGSSNNADFMIGGSSGEAIQVGYVYRLGYSYYGRYLIETSGRYDGHYYFAPGNRFGFFPSISLGWIISDEEFMASLKYINSLKLRTSFGKSGNLAGRAYQYLAGYTFRPNQYAFGENMIAAAYSNTEPNPNITWEVSNKYDIGLEGILFGNKLTFEIDYFYERRNNMLLPPAIVIPFEYGIELSDENEGIMDNNGIEIIASSHLNFSDGLKLNISGNFSFARNKMVNIFETSATYDNINRRRTGRPLNTLFGYKSLGLFKLSDDSNNDGIINEKDGYNITQFGNLHPGDIQYLDVNNDGVIDSDDEVVIGFAFLPEITYGMTTDFEIGKFDLSIFLQGVARNSFSINNRFQTVSLFNTQSNTDYEYYNNRWTPENQFSKYPRSYIGPNQNNNIPQSDFWIRRGDYLRIKNVEVGYLFELSKAKSDQFNLIRVYLSGVNLLTFSKVDFFDPEAIFSGSAGQYPPMKQLFLGINLKI